MGDRSEVEAFFKALQTRVFAPDGFVKKHHTFTRTHGDYAVAFQFQGSDWNDQSRPWRFYLNAGIQFCDVPPRSPDKDFPKIHSWMRVGRTLSTEAEPDYELTMEDIPTLIARMQTIVADCTRYFQTHHEQLKEAYTSRPVPYLGYLDKALGAKEGTPNQAL